MDIVVERLQKQYGLRRRVLDGINLYIGPGMFGILGPNGSGKTTLLRIVATRILATRGRVRIGPYDLRRAAGRQAVRGYIGYVPQGVHVYEELTGRGFLEYVGLLKSLYPAASRGASVADLLDRFGLTPVADYKVASYSTGMKRRLCVAQAFLGSPDVLIVDEPTVGLDPEERARLRTTLAEFATTHTVLLATNLVEDVSQLCFQVAMLHEGMLAFIGTPADLAATARDYTWEVSSHAAYAPPDTHQVVSTRTMNGQLVYRLVGPKPPGIDARTVTPTIDDGYVRLIQRGACR